MQGFLADHFAGQAFVKVMPLDAAPLLDNGFLPATTCNDTNRAEIFVFGHEEQILVAARFDNLGKGASGAAIQCMNLMLGMDRSYRPGGLTVSEARRRRGGFFCW